MRKRYGAEPNRSVFSTPFIYNFVSYRDITGRFIRAVSKSGCVLLILKAVKLAQIALSSGVRFLNILSSAMASWLCDGDALLHDDSMTAATPEPSCFTECRCWYWPLPLPQKLAFTASKNDGSYVTSLTAI